MPSAKRLVPRSRPRAPEDGLLPQNPEAWLLTTARHSLVDVIRQPARVSERADARTPEGKLPGGRILFHRGEFPDERLKIALRAAHPAIIPPSTRRLCCQTVLG